MYRIKKNASQEYFAHHGEMMTQEQNQTYNFLKEKSGQKVIVNKEKNFFSISLYSNWKKYMIENELYEQIIFDSNPPPEKELNLGVKIIEEQGEEKIDSDELKKFIKDLENQKNYNKEEKAQEHKEKILTRIGILISVIVIYLITLNFFITYFGSEETETTEVVKTQNQIITELIIKETKLKALDLEKQTELKKELKESYEVVKNRNKKIELRNKQLLELTEPN